MSEIASQANVTKPTIYYHFKSKSGLFQALVDIGYDKITRLMEAAIQTDHSCYEKLLTMLSKVFDFTSANRELVWIIFATRFYTIKELPSEQSHLEKGKCNFDLIHSVILEGLDAGELSGFNSRDLAKHIYGQMVFFIMTFLVNPVIPLDASSAKNIVRLFFDGAAGKKN